MSTAKPCCARTAPSAPMHFSEREADITTADLSDVSGDFFPSASGIRKLLSAEKDAMDFSRFIPAAAFPVFSSALEKKCWLLETALDLPLHYKLLLETEETLTSVSGSFRCSDPPDLKIPEPV